MDEALRVGIEASDKSLSRVGVYNILGALSKASSSEVPFQDGEPLPPWFARKYPELSEDERDHSDGDDAQSDRHSVPSPMTSIPEDFDPGTSESDSNEANDSGNSEDLHSGGSAAESEYAESAEEAEGADAPFGEEVESA